MFFQPGFFGPSVGLVETNPGFCVLVISIIGLGPHAGFDSGTLGPQAGFDQPGVFGFEFSLQAASSFQLLGPLSSAALRPSDCRIESTQAS